MRISDWSSDVCSSDLHIGASPDGGSSYFVARSMGLKHQMELALLGERFDANRARELGLVNRVVPRAQLAAETDRSEEHTSELQSLMRISYAVFCLKQKNRSESKVDK